MQTLGYAVTANVYCRDFCAAKDLYVSVLVDSLFAVIPYSDMAQQDFALSNAYLRMTERMESRYQGRSPFIADIRITRL